MGDCPCNPALLPGGLLQGEQGQVGDAGGARLVLQVVQEYERAVIFRLGRLLSGGSKGPGKWKMLNVKLSVFGPDGLRAVKFARVSSHC